ncbi:hypothetical protein F0U59_50495 [Archangium gephyra]|nr:hypothetical protein F0U59_50495 [Archangium gephyra]
MRRYVLPLALLMAPLCAFAQELSDSRLIQLNRMTSPPASRTSRRPVLAPEYGGWTVYTGQMHAHTRGHDESVIALPRTLTYAYRYGWDFFARTNHTSSWESYDSNRGFRENYVEAPWTDNMLVVHGIESHLDIYSDPGTHRLHYNTFNGWARTYGGDMSDMSDEVLPRYHPDPLQSIHVQMNHPDSSTNARFKLPADANQRAMLREIVEVSEVQWGTHDAEYWSNIGGYFEALRNGWRVSPTAQYDIHAQDPAGPVWTEKDAAGNFLRPFMVQPGIPVEEVERANGRVRDERLGKDGRGWTGMMVPSGTPWSYATFLEALRARRTFRSSMEGGTGFYVAGGRPMGDEFALSDNRARLQFWVWGKALANYNGQLGNYFTKAQLWSPFRPDQPVAEVDLPAHPTDLTRAAPYFAVTPYESIYLVRLQGPDPRADVLLAPVWITNPTPRPNSPAFLFPWRGSGQLLMWSGGGYGPVHIQTADVNADGTRGAWRTVATVDNINKWVCDLTNERTRSDWRVVDAADETVFSAPTRLTLPSLPPIGSFDYADTTGLVRGWTFDQSSSQTLSNVRLLVNGYSVGTWPTGVSRPDVFQVYGTGGQSGFNFYIPESYRYGSQTISIESVDTDGTSHVILGSKVVQFPPPPEVEDPGDENDLCMKKPWLIQCGGGL